jgi:hypothetical protein
MRPHPAHTLLIFHVTLILPKNAWRSKWWVVGWVDGGVMSLRYLSLLTLQCPRGPFEAFVVRFFEVRLVYNHVFRTTRDELWLWRHFVVSGELIFWALEIVKLVELECEKCNVYIHSCINRALYMHGIRLCPLDGFIWTVISKAAFTFPPSLPQILCNLDLYQLKLLSLNQLKALSRN